VTSTQNCVQFLINAACATGGKGLDTVPGGTEDADCGETGHPACVNQYVDYLDADGNPLGGGLAPPANWFYRRVWKIDLPPGTANLKRITVTCKTRSVVGQGGATGQAPHATLVMFKTFPF